MVFSSTNDFSFLKNNIINNRLNEYVEIITISGPENPEVVETLGD